MAANYLLDTNICSYIRRQRPPELLARFQQLAAGEAAISIITYGELHFGAAKSQNPAVSKNELSNLVGALPVLPLSPEAGVCYGDIRADLERRGEVICGNDLWIAAHAMAEGLILVTNNEREFQRVKGLKVENWAISGTAEIKK
jgi:tRNA(fMet)-specific endonuclease VapC